MRLLEVEPRIAGGLKEPGLAAARDQLLAPYADIQPGVWTPNPALRRAIAVLVFEGKLLCSRQAGDRADLALVGAGDLLDARRIDLGYEWRAIERTRLAMIDARFLLAARSWPQLAAGLVDRVFDSAREQRELVAVAKLPRIEERLLGFMTQVTARWGTVLPDGVVVSLPVTHETVGRLVGAQRPTVTIALSQLSRQGLLRRVDRRQWWMPATSATAGAVRGV